MCTGSGKVLPGCCRNCGFAVRIAECAVCLAPYPLITAHRPTTAALITSVMPSVTTARQMVWLQLVFSRLATQQSTIVEMLLTHVGLNAH